MDFSRSSNGSVVSGRGRKTKIKTAMETGNNHASVFNARPSFFNQYILQNGDAVDTAQKFKTFLSEIDFNHEIFDFITVD